MTADMLSTHSGRKIKGVYLEENVRTHGFSMGNDRLLVFALAIPTVELDTP